MNELKSIAVSEKTKEEFDILLFKMKRKNQLKNQDQLMQALLSVYKKHTQNGRNT